MILVFAKNKREFDYFLMENDLNPKFFRYVFSIQDLYGMPRGTLYYLTDLHYENTYWYEYEEHIMTRNLKQVDLETIKIAQQIINDARCTL